MKLIMNLINDVVNIIMTRISNKKLELTLDVNPDLPHELHGDNIRVKQIIVNLANNAVKFTDSGNVHLKIDFKQTKEDQIILKAEIADTGSGIKWLNCSSHSSRWTVSVTVILKVQCLGLQYVSSCCRLWMVKYR